METIRIKEMAYELEADLCGIASVDRFNGAPQGYHPQDVLPDCQSIVVLGSRFLKSTLSAVSTIPYTDVRNRLTRKMDDMAIELSYQLEAINVNAVPINAIGPSEWDAAANKCRGIISLKHAAELAGLGKIGKNTLLVNETFGNMVWLSAILISDQLKPDPIIDYHTCSSKCTLCLDSCPMNALDGVSINQEKCWKYAFGTHNGGEWRIKCFECRKICPNCFGLKKKYNTKTTHL